jgi:phosphoglycolate phosphatase-like HAD superfamily hydrolase
MASNSVYDPELEKTIKALEFTMAFEALYKGLNVIVDDTNLRKSDIERWEQIAKIEFGCHFEVKDFRNVSVDECILRDSQRENSVGRVAIERMALSAGLLNFDEDVVVYDLDGTVCDHRHRLHLIVDDNGDRKNRANRNWKEFFEQIHLDPIYDNIVEEMREHKRLGRMIVVLTARAEDIARPTVEHLKTNNVPFDRIFMRNSGDYREGTIVKREIISKLPKDKIVMVYDDDPKQIAMFKELGLPVTDVGTWGQLYSEKHL